MSDIKSMLSNIETSTPFITTTKKTLYRPKSSSSERQKGCISAFQHTSIKDALDNKPEIKASSTFRKLFQEEMKLSNREDVASKNVALKIHQNHRKMKMQKYLKENPQSKAQKTDNIFANRKTLQYDRYDVPICKKQARLLKPQVKEQLSPTRITNVVTPKSEATPKASKNVSVTVSRTSERLKTKGQTPKLELSLTSSVTGFQPRKSQSQKKYQNPEIEEQLDEQMDNMNNEDKLNKIIDLIGDSKLNNILWNDPAVRQIIEEMNIYDQKQLDEYLEGHTQYFVNLFKSSPFGSFKLHYVRPKNTTYDRQFVEEPKMAQTFNEIPYVTDEQYETLAKLYSQTGRIPNKMTIHQTEFYAKQSKTDKIIPPTTIILQPQPRIAATTSYQMNFPNRGDYDPNRIFKRLKEENVVTGAEWIYRTSYQDSFGKNRQSLSNEKLISIEYVRERNQAQKKFHTSNNLLASSNYQDNFKGKKARYNRPLPFKYATELEKPVNLSLPQEAYQTGKFLDSKNIVEGMENINKNKRKVIAPWKFRILSKLKALMEYKRFLTGKRMK